jgi:DNA polymerase (family 10)
VSSYIVSGIQLDNLKENDKAIEINASPYRLDLTDILVKEAIKKGVKLIINTDSHSKESLTDMKFGVAVARRGWAQKRDILNTLPYNEFRKWFLKQV